MANLMPQGGARERRDEPLHGAPGHGDVTREDLRGLTAQLIVVYTALEDVARAMGDDPVFRCFHDPALARLDTLKADLVALSLPGEAEVPVTAAARAYAARIRQVGFTAPALVAHHYTRYLGDLSGGQALGAIFGRALGLQLGEPGISFYRFETIEKVKPYKDGYRAALDEAPMDEAAHDAAVAEAIVAFQLNQDVFASLEDLAG
ncbi:biliverdin-producing heme oxygenase [Tessaracoccus coleopterorum]|uniref:biliverdin-producing heme oxygenase n=1 Tax=Tessaracoccus coleopterorum TaxID=2714950 RepID=UPI0018D3EA8A